MEFHDSFYREPIRVTYADDSRPFHRSLGFPELKLECDDKVRPEPDGVLASLPLYFLNRLYLVVVMV